MCMRMYGEGMRGNHRLPRDMECSACRMSKATQHGDVERTYHDLVSMTTFLRQKL